jgi:hypothetical protein
VKAIAAAMVKVQANLKGARKTKENPHLKTKYADLASVWEACHEALTTNEIAVIQAPKLRENGTLYCETKLLHVSGEELTGEYLVRPTKEDPQGYGSAFTYARRYSLLGMIGITNEDDDGNAGSGLRHKRADIEKVKKTGVVTAVQRIALSKAWRSNGWTDEQAAAFLADRYEISSTSEIKAEQYPEVLTAFSNRPPQK